jgi:hypothetical protein
VLPTGHGGDVGNIEKVMYYEVSTYEEMVWLCRSTQYSNEEKEQIVEEVLNNLDMENPREIKHVTTADKVEEKQKRLLELFAVENLTAYEATEKMNCNCPVVVIAGLIRLLVKKKKLVVVEGEYRKGEVDKLYPVFKLKV